MQIDGVLLDGEVDGGGLDDGASGGSYIDGVGAGVEAARIETVGVDSAAAAAAEQTKGGECKEREAVSGHIGVPSGFCRTTTTGGIDSPSANRSPEWHVGN